MNLDTLTSQECVALGIIMVFVVELVSHLSNVLFQLMMYLSRTNQRRRIKKLLDEYVHYSNMYIEGGYKIDGLPDMEQNIVFELLKQYGYQRFIDGTFLPPRNLVKEFFYHLLK